LFPHCNTGCTDVDDAPGRLWCATTDSYDRDGERADCVCASPDHRSAVFYTTDGIEPTLKSNVYDAQFGIQLHGFGDRTVKVKNFQEGSFDSPVVEACYSILPQTVSTLAGSSVGSPGHQDGFGTFSGFSNPTKLVISLDQNDAYIADSGNDRIRRFNMQSGFTSTLAGGSKGFEDGVATHAQFNQPHGLALTRDGAHLYVGDSGNAKIRKIQVASGTVETVFTLQHEQTLHLFKSSDAEISMMSTGQMNVFRSSMIYESRWVDNDHEVRCKSNSFLDSLGHTCVDYDIYPQWCGFEASAHSCCICGGGTDNVVKRSASSFSFGEIRGLSLSLDETVLYVCDSEKNTVNAIILSTGQIRIIAGGGTISSKDSAYGTRAGFHHPFGLTVAPKTESGLSQKGETIYIVDQDSIRTLDTASGLVRGVLVSPHVPTICDDADFFCNNGCMANAAVSSVRDIVMSADGYAAYVSDTTGVRAITQQGVCHVAGGSSLRSDHVDSWDRSCARFSSEYGGGIEIISPSNPNSTTPTVLVADTRNNKLRAASIDPDPSHCIKSLKCPVCGDGNVHNGVDAGFEACDAQAPFNHIEGCTYYCRVLPGYVCNWDYIGKGSCARESLLAVLPFRVDSDAVCKSKCDATLNCMYATFLQSAGTCELHSNSCGQGFRAQEGLATWMRSSKTTRCSSVCGDGVRLTAYEQCDDMNLAINDGCSDSCTIEVGWHCQGGSNAPIQEADANMDICEPICGDKLRVGSEIRTLKCDDGNRNNQDGCSAGCNIEVPHSIDDITITRMNRTQAFIQLRHVPLSSSAKLGNSLHRVYYYIAMVNRTLCDTNYNVDGHCTEKLTNFTFNYSNCPYEVQLQTEITPAVSAWACERTCYGMPGLCMYATYSSSDLVEYDVGDFSPKCTLYLYRCLLESVQNSYGTSVLASCGETFCTFYQNGLQPGEFLNVTVVSKNVAGFSSPAKVGLRWTVSPSPDVVFEYGELPVARNDWQRDGFQIVIFWNPPTNTGWGDSMSLPILEYGIEVSLCNLFDSSDTLCGPTWRENFIPGTFVAGTKIDDKRNLSTYSGLEQSTCSTGWEKFYDCVGRDNRAPFTYPFQLNISRFDLHNGFYYFYRFTSRNKQGWSQYSIPVRHQYGSVPFERPFVDLPGLSLSFFLCRFPYLSRLLSLRVCCSAPFLYLGTMPTDMNGCQDEPCSCKNKIKSIHWCLRQRKLVYARPASWCIDKHTFFLSIA